MRTSSSDTQPDIPEEFKVEDGEELNINSSLNEEAKLNDIGSNNYTPTSRAIKTKAPTFID